MPEESAIQDWWQQAQQWVALETTFFHNTLVQWLMAAGIALLSWIILRIAIAVVLRRLGKWAERSTTDWDDALLAAGRAIRGWFLLALALYLGFLSLTLPAEFGQVVQSLVIIAVLVQGALCGNVLVSCVIEHYSRAKLEENAAAVTTMSALGFLAKVALWSIVLLLVMDNLGIDVTALIAGLSVGGIAISLAAQSVLGDLLASLSIVFDKPFVLGDFIIVGDCMGSVEHIGLKTTRLRSISGEQLIFPNGDLLGSRIHNYKRMQQRRIVFTVGVTYETPQQKLPEISRWLEAIVSAQQDIRFDRAHFKSFGDFALIYEVVYYVLTSDYLRYMDVQQAINLAIAEKFAAEGVEFAYPTNRVILDPQSSSSPQAGPMS